MKPSIKVKEMEKRIGFLETRLGQEDSVDAMDLLMALSRDALEFLIEIMRAGSKGDDTDTELAEYAAETLGKLEAILEAYLAGELSLAEAKEMVEGIVETAEKEGKWLVLPARYPWDRPKRLWRGD